MITVLMPTYNAAGKIGRSIRSILEQTFREFELLIMDDGSTDDTVSVVLSIKDPRIRYIRLEHGGIVRTLNAGLQTATFAIIARMDAGDIALPERLAVQHSLLQRLGPGNIIGCHYAMFSETGVQYLIRGAAEHADIRRRLALHPDLPHPGILYYKADILEAGGYRDVRLEDYDLWLRVKDRIRFHAVPQCLLLVEHSPTSLTNANVQQRYRDHYRLQEPYYHDLAQEFGLLDRTEQIRMRGWREYFYGSPRSARTFWSSISADLLIRPSMLIAFLMTFLPGRPFIAFKESRWRQRLHYLLNVFGAEERRVRSAYRYAMNAGEERVQ